MRFLVVDDDFVIRSLMITILSQYGICDVAVSGEEAVMAVKYAYSKGTPYSAIFLDIRMPGGKDGIEALTDLKTFEKARSIKSSQASKIIMVTALDSPDTVMEAFKDQCDAYLLKPINQEKILKSVLTSGLVLRERHHNPS